MKFLKLVRNHWIVSILLLFIAFGTAFGVYLVSADAITVSLDKTSVVFFANPTDTKVAETIHVSVSGTFTEGNNVTGCTWSSSNPLVCDVSGNQSGGTVTAKGAGLATITAEVSFYDGTSQTASANVTVNLTTDAATVITSTLQTGNTTPDIRTNAPLGSNVTWETTNSNITVITPSVDSRSATITAGDGGEATVTARLTGTSLAASFKVGVGVKITNKSVVGTLNQGDSVALTVNSSNPAGVYFWSDNENVATVDENGLVTAQYAGTTNICASSRSGDVSAGAGDYVQVEVPFEIKNIDTTIQVGDKITVPTTALPNQVTYNLSNNLGVLSYDTTTQLFTALKTGTADITVTWGSFSDTKTITVLDGFTLSKNSLNINIGKKDSVTALVSSTEPVTWEIADPSLASVEVSPDGLTATVTALDRGEFGVTSLVASQTINGVVKTSVCTVNLLNPVKSLILMYNGKQITTPISIAKGNNIFINAYLNFGEDLVPANTNLSWVSSDSTVLALNPTTTSGQQQLCEIQALSGGNATITVVSEDGLYIATADFYVTEGVNSITLDKTEVVEQMALQKFQLTATILPDSEGVDKTVKWESLNPGVVTVDQNGLVKFVSPGETYVSATSVADPTKVAYCHFTIEQQVTGVTMDYKTLTLNVGDEYRLTAVVAPSNATHPEVTWSSSNAAVCTVDDNGMLNAKSSGSATIIVQTKDGGYLDMTNVTVLQPVGSIVLSETEMSVKKGTEFWINATVLPETSDNKKVKWASSDTSLATIDQTGHVTTLGVGTVTISCISEDNGTAAYCIVDITDPVTGLKLNTYYQEIVMGNKFVLIPEVLPFDAVNKNCTFKSTDDTIATVDESGIIFGVKGGECDIIVTTEESNFTAVCKIVVKEFVTSVEISGEKEYLNVKDTLELKATVLTESASNKGVIWTSSNPLVATVDSKGKVKGISVGNVVITATAADGSGMTDSVVIKVVIPVEKIDLSHSKITIYVGDTFNVSATIKPENATVKKIEWYSDDESVAKVYPDGDIVGISAGRTIVHARSTDGNNVISDCTVIVKNPVLANRIKINSSEITMLKGKSRTLTARIYPTNTNESIRWESSDTSVVTVSNGKIITVGAGECTVTAYSSLGTVSDTCKIYSMAMSATDIKLEQYDTFNLYVDGAPKTINWRSSNPRIASVDQNGVVTARMPGECRITATSDSKTVTCYVKVMAVDPGKFINVEKNQIKK